VKTAVAQLAARLMAEEGVPTPSQAKKKAAKQLGLESGTGLPTDQEVTEALREYQSIFVSEHEEELLLLRQAAMQAMELLVQFKPVLVGAVADGSATAFSDIELELSADSGKDVELFLINRRIGYVALNPVRDREASLRCDDWEPAVVLHVADPMRGRRSASRTEDGGFSRRLDVEALAALIEAE